MRLSKRFETIEPYLFVGISRTIAEKKQQGIDVISFGIGDPDISTPDFVLDSLKKHSSNPKTPTGRKSPLLGTSPAGWEPQELTIFRSTSASAIRA